MNNSTLRRSITFIDGFTGLYYNYLSVIRPSSVFYDKRERIFEVFQLVGVEGISSLLWKFFQSILSRVSCSIILTGPFSSSVLLYVKNGFRDRLGKGWPLETRHLRWTFTPCWVSFSRHKSIIVYLYCNWFLVPPLYLSPYLFKGS